MSENTVKSEELLASAEVQETSSASVELDAASKRSSGQNPRKRRVLGRGLSALMQASAVSVDPDFAAPAPSSFAKSEQDSASVRPFVVHSAASSHARVESEGNTAALSEAPLEGGMMYLAIERIVANSSQPRQSFPPEDIDSLGQSIKETGLLQPIIVRKKAGEVGPLASYEIVAGERRWRAAKSVGLTRIPALVRQLSDRETLELGIVENVQRSDLNPVEEALAYHRLMSEHGATQEQVAQAVGKDRVSISNAVRLLKLSSSIQGLMIAGNISAGHGRALLMVEDEARREALAARIKPEGLSVREVERLAGEELSEESKTGDVSAQRSSTPKSKTPEVVELESRFRRALGTKVNLKVKKTGKGELRIFFFSQSELESLLDRLDA